MPHGGHRMSIRDSYVSEVLQLHSSSDKCGASAVVRLERVNVPHGIRIINEADVILEAYALTDNPQPLVPVILYQPRRVRL